MKNEIMVKRIEKLLHLVQKPARYIGCEFNIIVKESPLVRVAISYPDLYEVAMANNGIRILYEAVNRIEDAACERVFAVAPDFEAILREHQIPLYSLESFTPIYNMDMIGFNLAHELLITNVLQILDLGKIPLLRKDRDEGHPIIVGGGEFASNPFPAALFFDLFFIGEGEEGLPEIVNTIARAKGRGLSRSDTIREIGKIDSVLICEDYDFAYNGIEADISSKKVVRKRTISCEKALFIEKPIVPLFRISQERAVVELSRGCFNLCKFCHAGYYNLPYRIFSPERIAREIFAQIDNTGYDEVTLTALSSSDYKYLVTLLNIVLPGLTARGVSLSLPSLKVDKNTLHIIETISGVRKSSLTFAVESASEQLRTISNKKVKTEDLLEIVDFAFKHGWKTIKLYFMIGLPGCEDVDEAETIIELLHKLSRLGKRKEINVTVSPFVPKPHTPFQFEKQMDMEYFYNVIKKIKSNAPKHVTIKNHDVRSSFLEGLIARADERFGHVILNAYLKGARLDSWHEYFNFDLWKESLEEKFPKWRDLLLPRKKEGTYPWQLIETGNEKAVDVMMERTLDLASYKHPEYRYSEFLNEENYKEAMKNFEEKYITADVIRFIFSKTGYGRFVPHIDFTENVKRALRMANVPMSYSQGFNKREKLSTGFPLPLGIESLSEIVDVELFKTLSDEQLQEILIKVNKSLPDVIRLVKVRRVSEKQTVMAATAAVKYNVFFKEEGLLEKVMDGLKNRERIEKRSKDVAKEYPLCEVVHSFSVEDNLLSIVLFMGKESSMRVDELIAGLASQSITALQGVSFLKICQYRNSNGNLELIE